MKSVTRSRAATVTALSLVLSVGMAAGCGGDGDSGGPEDAFIGRWFQTSPDPSDPLGTGFTLSCADPGFANVFNPQTVIWGSLVFEHGELTDLAETSGNCSPLNYDINGKTATIPNPDPYFDDVPGCLIPFTLTDQATGLGLNAAFIFTPDPSWSFMLLNEKTAQGADQARLVGSGHAKILVEDGTESMPDCTYAGSDTFFRLTRP
jgi:hypothetical protein